jgi:transcriptional regulator with XRE-family HTH domain
VYSDILFFGVISVTINEKIKTARILQKISQRELAERLGVTQQNIQQLESGKRDPKLKTIRKIAAALNVDFYELVYGDVQESVRQFPDDSDFKVTTFLGGVVLEKERKPFDSSNEANNAEDLGNLYLSLSSERKMMLLHFAWYLRDLGGDADE